MIKSRKTANKVTTDIVELARHLRQEHLFVSNEKQQLQKLNEKVLNISSRLFQLSWISRQQRINLDKLILSHSSHELTQCCHTSNALDSVVLIDAYKRLSGHDSAVSELLSLLRKNPELVAACLASGEKTTTDLVPHLCHIIMSSIYCNCILPEDKVFVLQLLKELLNLQLASSENPRRHLRHGSCAFSRVYRIFSEEDIDAKIFLTAALHDGVMHLLAEDDLFLDIDPNKAVIRFAPQERLRHFGHEGTAAYETSLQNYRQWTINKLAALAMRFIRGIEENIHFFPQSIGWIVKLMYSVFAKSKKIETKEIEAICADVVFEFFICPAIISPDLYGITDAHISHIARFNLMQVAQIIQLLAMSKRQEIDPKFDDLMKKFEGDSLSKALKVIFEKISDAIPLDGTNFGNFVRNCVLISEVELKMLVNFLKTLIQSQQDMQTQSKFKMLIEVIEKIPDKFVVEDHDKAGKRLSGHSLNSSEHSPKSRKGILTRVTRRTNNKLNDLKNDGISQTNSTENLSGSAIDFQQISEVIVVPLSNDQEVNCLGLMNEEKVLRLEQQKRPTKVRMNPDLLTANTQGNEETESVVSATSGGNETATEKRTRFFLSQDQESIGTSDNLEAISEAASNHSVGSSIDLENENDNMSDMVSANVSSGRGTPNVSGRDTPSSHSPNHSSTHSSDEEAETLENSQAPQQNLAQAVSTELNAIPITQPNRPNNRDDIEDKFGKFDIKQAVPVDETKSMLSDTWSTDVLASDSEAFEQQDTLSAATSAFSQISHLNLLGFPGHSQQILHVLDSETASQSDAWSTDVLTSDTERMQEFDPDDSLSVTRSDDMSVTRSEPDDENFAGDLSGMENDSCKDGTLRHRNSFRHQNMSNNVLLDSQETLVNTTVDSSDSALASSQPNECESPLVMQNKSDSQQSTNPLLPLTSNMQSLGRLTFDIKKLDENSSKSNTVQENNNTVVSLNMQNHRTLNHTKQNVAELLSADPSTTGQGETIDQNSQLKHSKSLIEFEKEILLNQKLLNSDAETGDAKSSASDAITCNFRSNPANINSSELSFEKSNKLLEQETNSSPQKHPNPYASTGAIPKTPNFGRNRFSLNKFPVYHGFEDEFSKNSAKKSFFKLPNLKSTLKDKMRSFKDTRRSSSNFPSENTTVEENKEAEMQKTQSSDDILAKYRAKVNPSDLNKSLVSNGDLVGELEDTSEIDESEVFNRTKRKIRRVLSCVDVLVLTLENSTNKSNDERTNDLSKLLKILLSEAIHLKHPTNVVMLHEALRSIQSLDANGSQKLFWSLREDYQRRSSYIAYLTRCKQQLLSILAFFNSLLEHVEHDKFVCLFNLISISVRQFLEKKEKSVQLFIKKFQMLVVADEKAQLVDKFLSYLFQSLESDCSWQAASEDQLEFAKQVIERHVMSQIYILALYPNGDGDVFRDQILNQHIQQLSKTITPNHKDLMIKKIYHSECPWPSAQAEIVAIGAHKTPRDKVRCVVRCCTTIMNLLSLANDKAVPAADDFMPVLVFVLIKANPPSLLSMVQFVNSFYDKAFEGEESYWWTQFCSAVEFIKTID